MPKIVASEYWDKNRNCYINQLKTVLIYAADLRAAIGKARTELNDAAFEIYCLALCDSEFYERTWSQAWVETYIPMSRSKYHSGLRDLQRLGYINVNGEFDLGAGLLDQAKRIKENSEEAREKLKIKRLKSSAKNSTSCAKNRIVQDLAQGCAKNSTVNENNAVQDLAHDCAKNSTDSVLKIDTLKKECQKETQKKTTTAPPELILNTYGF